MLGAIFKKARQDIQNPATLRRGNRRADRHRELVQHPGRYQSDIYEGLLEKSAVSQFVILSLAFLPLNPLQLLAKFLAAVLVQISDPFNPPLQMGLEIRVVVSVLSFRSVKNAIVQDCF